MYSGHWYECGGKQKGMEQRRMRRGMLYEQGLRQASTLRPAPRGRGRARAIVVHSGARDAYQVARALYQAGRLSCLVTDLYWPGDRPLVAWFSRLLPSSLRAQLLQRAEPHLPSSRTRTLFWRGLLTLLLDKWRAAPFHWKRELMRSTDAELGRVAGRRADKTGATLLAYSYYAFHAFSESRAPGMLFQLHPHPASVRRILREELAAYPECAASLNKEWELALPEEDFARLVEEPRLASHILVASSFTRHTLVEQGTPERSITVVPYGVDCRRFSPGLLERKQHAGLNLLFVGRINQRKGIQYLLEALRLVNDPAVHLTVCGRVVDDLALFASFAGQVTVRPSVSHEDLLSAYRSADLFVLPSVAEGFGQVLLEALACGLPVLSTTHTAAPDLIQNGVQGFVVEPRRADQLAERISWALAHPAELASMRAAARAAAEHFTWHRFRQGVTRAFEAFVLEQGVEERSRSTNGGLEQLGQQAWQPGRPAPMLSGPVIEIVGEIENEPGVEAGHRAGKDRVLHV